MVAHFNYAVFQQRLALLIKETKNILSTSKNQDLVPQLEGELIDHQSRNQLRMAFVGQYSSGKSTIISALTGNDDIKIDANISTDVVAEYEWNNIILIDTPGILAGKVEAHDERTKAALEKCDLIAYVLTSQLFDDVIFNNFIDLAYNQHLADKMFIVVNKMNMEAGSFNELVNTYTESLQDIFEHRGYDVSKFPLAFIDASDYLEGLADGDDDFVELSHFESFISLLNAFVDKKGIVKKEFDTPVRILQSYLNNIVVSEIDATIADFYRQFEQRIVHSLKELKRDVNNDLYSFDSTAMTEVIQLSSQIGELSNEDWTREQQGLNNRLQKIIADTSSKIASTIDDNYERLMSEMNEFSNKDALVKYEQELDARISSPNISIQESKNLESQKKALIFIKKGGEGVANLAPGVTSVTGGISGASGSALHNVVLNIGHFFGHKFVPWQAVRWASNIAKVARFGIPVLVVVADAGMQVYNDKKEKQKSITINTEKGKFITAYQGEINRVKDEFQKYLLQIINNYNNKINEINDSKRALMETSDNNSKLIDQIKTLEGNYVSFLNDIDEQ